MHVAICSDGVFPEAIGGIERHTRLLIETISRFQPDVRVTVIHTHPGVRLFDGLANVSEVAIEPRAQKQQYLTECFRLAARFEEVLRSIPDAVVYSQGVCVHRRLKDFSSRLIVNPHGLESFQSLTPKEWAIAAPFRFLQRRTFRHARHLISLGGRLTAILERETGGIPGKVVVIPNGVVVPVAKPRPIRDSAEPIRLLFVGRLAPNKGVPDLLKGMDELGNRGASGRFRLDVVGGGPLLGALRAANKRPNVAFLDKVSDDRLEELYATADALVLPTLFEGMPTVVLEAMARGIPALVTDVGASKELVDDTNGQIIRKRDPMALADALLRLERIGPAGRAALGAAGRERVLLRFTWQKVAKAHVELFAQVAASMP